MRSYLYRVISIAWLARAREVPSLTIGIANTSTGDKLSTAASSNVFGTSDVGCDLGEGKGGNYSIGQCRSARHVMKERTSQNSSDGEAHFEGW
jgi:hypothetical protein